MPVMSAFFMTWLWRVMSPEPLSVHHQTARTRVALRSIRRCPFCPSASISSQVASLRKCRFFAGTLQLNELAVFGRDEIKIDCDGFVFFVVQDRRSALHQERRRSPPRQVSVIGGSRNLLLFRQFSTRDRDGEARTGDRSGARSAVGLQHIAIDPHRARSKFLRDRPPRATIDRSVAEFPCSARRVCPFVMSRGFSRMSSNRATSNIPPSASRRSRPALSSSAERFLRSSLRKSRACFPSRPGPIRSRAAQFRVRN